MALRSSSLLIGTFRRAMGLLPRRDQIRIVQIIILQSFLSVLDLLGVALVGVLGILAVNGVKSSPTEGKSSAVLKFLNISSLTFQQQVAILGVSAALVLIVRTVSSIYFTRKALFFLSLRGAHISSELISKILLQNLEHVRRRSSQDTLFAVTDGVSSITIGVIGASILLISDGVLLVVLTFGLVVVDPILAGCTLILYSILGYVMYKLLHKRVSDLGRQEAQLTIKSNKKILEVLGSYREVLVRNRNQYYSQEIRELRVALANTNAEISFMPSISKYVLEATVVVSAVFLSAIQFLTQDASHAVATLSVFMAAGSRIAPAVLRTQQGLLGIKGALANAKSTFELIEDLKENPSPAFSESKIDFEHLGFFGDVLLKDVSFKYEANNKLSLKGISLNIKHGSSIAIVGASGAGKSTLVDVILGILEPTNGEVTISGETPKVALSKWSGAVAYVPQDIVVIEGTVRENICLGYSADVVSDAQIEEVLRKANLIDFVKTLPNGIHHQVGEFGSAISGGQRQRLGIARALLTNPMLVVLDEATSALDAESEVAVAEAIFQLQGEVTVVMVAHRLSSLRHAQQVIYMENGSILAQGPFNLVRQKVSNFDNQAKLMGL